MPPQQSQPQIDPNVAKAGLGIATHLQSFLLPPQQNSQPAQDPNQGVPQNQTNQTDVKTEIAGAESRLMDEIQTIKAELKNQGDGKKELEDLKKQIETVLASTD